MKWCLLVAMLTVVGCASRAPQPEVVTGQQEAVRTDFDRALDALSQEKYQEAEALLRKILTQNPASEFDLVALYNHGAALEGLGRCREASEQYRRASQVAHKKYPRIAANSLLRLGYAYECLGQDSRALVAFLDARRFAGVLSDQAIRAEIPGRLASAYARLGQKKQAEAFLREALKGLKALQTKEADNPSFANQIAQTLFFMGQVKVSDDEFRRDPVRYLRGQTISQLYLLQAAEVGNRKWSTQSIDEILRVYERAWRFLEEPAREDSALEKLKVNLAMESLRGLRSLRTQRLPNQKESAQIAFLFQQTELHERKVEEWLQQNGPRTSLTPESQQRRGLKRDGRVRSAAPSVLEKEKSAP